MSIKNKNKYVKEVISKDIILAIILRTKFEDKGIKFFTPDNFSQQLGYMKREKGYIIDPHIHNPVTREVEYTKEVLFIKSGEVSVDLYNQNMEFIQNEILYQGDFILLASGGHGFRMKKDSEIIEIKQGPYLDKLDKKRF